MRASLREQARRRAGGCCEYCHTPEGLSELRFQVDHVIAEKHGGPLLAGNLAWACFRCNSHKGPNLSGWEERSGVFRLFNPRFDLRDKHFRWAGARLDGKTVIGALQKNVA